MIKQKTLSIFSIFLPLPASSSRETVNESFELLTGFLFRPLLRGEELYTQMGFFVQSILADTVLEQSWTVTIQKNNLDCNQSVFFIKKIDLFMLLK